MMSKSIEKNITLDKKHTQMLEEFKYNEEILIPKLKEEIDRLNKFLNNSKNKKKIEKIEIVGNKIKELSNQINNLERNRKEYYLNNSKHIFEYFEEKKKYNK